MAVMMIMRWDGITIDTYDEARRTIDWEGNVPQGARYHVAAHDGAAMRVTDVWDSAEDFQRFVETRLRPGMQSLGVRGEPQVEVYPAHAIFAPAYQPQHA